MTEKQLYTHLYKLFDGVTPLNVDCGGLCNGACCEGDGETGMYLFPNEEVMYDGSEKWLEIYDSDFIFDGKPVKIAICDGTCDRKKRPLSCRIFPLFAGQNGLVHDIRGKGLCPLVTATIPFSQFNPRFIKNVTRAFNVLDKFRVTKAYVRETQKIIDSFQKSL